MRAAKACYCGGRIRERVCDRCGPRRPVGQSSDRATAHVRGYTGVWQRARARYLREHPICVACEREGATEPATVVDHVTPHRGDYDRFWDADNWQPLCARHHAAKTARGE